MIAVGAGSARAAPLEAYGRLPGVTQAALSPSGKYYAIVGEVLGQRRVVIAEVGGKPVMVAPLGEEKVRDILWAGDDHLLVFASLATNMGPRFALLKYEVGQLLVLNTKTQKNFWVLSEGVNGAGVWGFYGIRFVDKHWYAYVAGIKRTVSPTSNRVLYLDNSPDLFRVDLDTNETRVIAENQGTYSARSWSVGLDGKIEAVLDYDQKTGHWEISPPGKPPVAQGTDALGDTLLAGIGRSWGTIVYRERDPDGEDAWKELRLDTGQSITLFKGVRIAELFHDPWTGLWVGYRRDADHPDNRFFDEYAGDRVQAAELAFPGETVRVKSWDLLFDRIIVQTEGAQDSGTWWIVDIKTGKADIIGRSYPKVRDAEVAPVKMVRWTTADGLEEAGVLTLPPGKEAKGLPLLVLPHDGPAQRDYPQFDWIAQAFASQGYAVFQPNFRGSEGYGADFRQAGAGEWGKKMQTDISDGVAELAKQGVVDPKRACIMGMGYGGYAALAGVTLQHGFYRCAVGVNAITDLPRMHFYLTYKSGRVGATLRNFRAETGTDDQLTAVSPSKHAREADAPILLIHGDDDTEVPIEQGRAMEKALKGAGRPVEFLELDGEDHWLSRDDTRLSMLKAAVAFVEAHNPAS
ncbi:MAG: prolyl oligopeptidase family serine peptidase [Parcubacteria group bacterium]